MNLKKRLAADGRIIRKTSVKKLVITMAVLLLFLFVTNPSLIFFLPEEARASLGNVWQGLFGDVDTIIDSLTLNWSSLFKLAAMVLLLLFLTVLTRFILERIEPKSGRGRSIVSLVNSALNYFVLLVGIFWGMAIIGVGVSTIFASAGIVALVLSFGAESLIADVLTGLFLVFDNQFNIGDIIEVNGFRGTVERIGIRTTYVRDAGNNIKIINNSDIRNVLNRSDAASYAACTVSVSYAQPLEEAEKALSELLPKIREKYPTVFLDAPEYRGVENLGSSSVDLRIVALIGEENIYQAPRILNRELKIGFEKAGIEIPYPQIVVHPADK